MKLEESYVNARQEAIGIINDSITNIFGIKTIRNLPTEFNLKLKPAITAWKDQNRKARKFDAYYVDNADTIMSVIMSIVQICLLAYPYQRGEITPGEFTFIAMMTLKIQFQIDKFLENLLFNINPSIAQVRPSYAFINRPIDIADKPDTTLPPRDSKRAIEYKNVSFSYGDKGTKVLSNFNLKINPGEHIGIVGSSGAGKTTMTKCLLRYLDLCKGAVLVDGHDIRDITEESLRASISIIPQDITMLHRSIKENLRLAKYNATNEEIITACKKAKIDHDIMAMTEGYETIVGERRMKPSGGQRQRIAIARAILKNAPILILDEATSNLDSSTEKLIQASIHDVLLASKATVIAIAHRLSTIKQMDRIIVLDHGKIVEMGKHTALIQKKDSFYKKLWEMQAI